MRARLDCMESESDRFDRKMRAMYGTKRYCAVCGETSTGISRAGVSSCNEHPTAKPEDARFDWCTGHPLAQENMPPSTLPETTDSYA